MTNLPRKNQELEKRLILYLPYHPHEQPSQLVADLVERAAALGLYGPMVTVHKRLKPSAISEGSILVTDHLSRLGDDPFQAINFLYQLLTVRSCEVVIPKILDLRRQSSTFQEAMGILRTIVDLKGAIKSNKIKSGLWMAKQMGKQIGRTPLSPELRAYILQEYTRTPEIRPLVRRLKNEGINVSRSSLARLIKDLKANGGDE